MDFKNPARVGVGVLELGSGLGLGLVSGLGLESGLGCVGEGQGQCGLRGWG